MINDLLSSLNFIKLLLNFRFKFDNIYKHTFIGENQEDADPKWPSQQGWDDLSDSFQCSSCEC